MSVFSNRRRRQREKAARNAEEQAAQQEAFAQGVTDIETTGYQDFRTLMDAYRNKMAQLQQQNANTTRYSGISALVSRNKTLG